MEDKGQLQDIYYNSRIFTESDQKNAVIYREITAIVYALEVHEILIIDTEHPIINLRDHKPIASFFARKDIMYPHVSGSKLFSHAFQNLLLFGHTDESFA